jgi:hypothetical protein
VQPVGHRPQASVQLGQAGKLDDLVKAGLVERRQDPGDRRTRLVVATDHGRAILADLRARLALAEQHILAGLSPQEQQAFRALLATAAKHVNDPDPVRSACDAVEDITLGRHALLSRPDVALVHLRNVGYGCYNCTVRRGEDEAR